MGSVAVLIGGPQDGREVALGAIPHQGFDGGVSWRNEGRWLFWTEVDDRRYYVFEADALPLLQEDDGA